MPCVKLETSISRARGDGPTSVMQEVPFRYYCAPLPGWGVLWRFTESVGRMPAYGLVCPSELSQGGEVAPSVTPAFLSSAAFFSAAFRSSSFRFSSAISASSIETFITVPVFRPWFVFVS